MKQLFKKALLLTTSLLFLVGCSTSGGGGGDAKSGEIPNLTINISPNVDYHNIFVGDLLPITAEVFDEDGTKIEDPLIEWGSEDSYIAAVNSTGQLRGWAMVRHASKPNIV